MLQRDVAPGVHRVNDAFVNWYLVEDQGGLTVVDAGLASSWGSFCAALDELGLTFGDVEGVVLTHAHFDHVGIAERLRRDHGVRVRVHEDDADLTRHPLAFRSERLPLLYLHRPQNLRIFLALANAGAPWTPRIAQVTTFADGDVLDLPGRPRVVATPGHTDGHVALHLPERDAVITGDALVTLDPFSGRRGPRLVARAATADTDAALRSLDRLEALDATTALPGHGDPWQEGVPAAAAQARRTDPA